MTDYYQVKDLIFNDDDANEYMGKCVYYMPVLEGSGDEGIHAKFRDVFPSLTVLSFNTKQLRKCVYEKLRR